LDKIIQLGRKAGVLGGAIGGHRTNSRMNFLNL
jgi:hypothetical protein